MKKDYLSDLIRLIAHSKLLQEMVSQQHDFLLEEGWSISEGKFSLAEEVLNSTLRSNSSNSFIQAWYENVWGEIMEEEIWNENSPLVVQANDALPNSRSPYGYRFVYRANRPTLCIDAIETQVVKQIYFWYLQFDMSLRDIAKALSELNLPTPYNIHHKGKGNTQANWAQWDMTVVHRILTSSTYYGNWIFHDSHLNKKTLIPVPSIISREQFELVRAKLSESQNAKGIIVKTFLYPTRIQCDICGSKIRNEKKPQFYNCRCITENCLTRGFKLEQIDAIVLGWLFRRFGTGEDDAQELLLAFHQQCSKEIEEIDCSLQILESYSQGYKQRLKHLSKFKINNDLIVATQQRYESQLQYAVSGWQEKRKQLVKKKQELMGSSHNFTLKLLENDFTTQKRVMKAINMQIWIQGRDKERSLRIKCDFGEALLPYLGGKNNE